MSQLNIPFETDELNNFFETGTSINEMKKLILHLLKKQRKSQKINLNKLSNTLVAQESGETTSAPVVKTIPSNSGTSIAESLTDLTIDEMLETVLSNAFVPDVVTKNTIIWENWDIFSKSKYLWKVVRKRPKWVKLWVINKCYYLVCRPVKGNNNCYEALRCSFDGKLSRINHENKCFSLREAVSTCENFIDNKRRTNPYRVEVSKYGTTSKILDTILPPAEIEKRLFALGVKENLIRDLVPKGAYSCMKICEILSEDIEPDKEVLSQLRGKYMELDLLSKSEAQSILKQTK